MSKTNKLFLNRLDDSGICFIHKIIVEENRKWNHRRQWLIIDKLHNILSAKYFINFFKVEVLILQQLEDFHYYIDSNIKKFIWGKINDKKVMIRHGARNNSSRILYTRINGSKLGKDHLIMLDAENWKLIAPDKQRLTLQPPWLRQPKIYKIC